MRLAQFTLGNVSLGRLLRGLRDEIGAYLQAFEKSWLCTELNKVCNFNSWIKLNRARNACPDSLEVLVDLIDFIILT